VKPPSALPLLDPHTIELIGYAAAVLTTASFVPQVWKTWRSKSAGDLSVVMLAMFTTGVFLWLVYGLAHASVPITLANGVTFALAVFLLVLRLIFKKH
jgi:MtN3 and saliva related transmembrane protein